MLTAGWADDYRVTYKYDGMERQDYEEREDYSAGWNSRYDISQEYDKNGNRSRYHKNVDGGHTSDYGISEDLSYTFNAVNGLTAVTDADDANYSAAVSCDQNGNIVCIEETQAGEEPATLSTDFTGKGNRLGIASCYISRNLIRSSPGCLSVRQRPAARATGD